MGSAIIGGIVKAGVFSNKDIFASDISDAFLENLKSSFGISVTKSNIDIATTCQVIFLCVKPHIYSFIINEIKDHLATGTIIVTIAAGQTLDAVSSQFKDGIKVIRTMPNTPALVNNGMTAICPGKGVTEEEKQLILDIFNSVGKSTVINENLFDIFTGVAGSSPAYAFMFIEAMGDAGVKYGLTKSQAIQFAAQTFLGAAQMVLQSNEGPSILKDNVCSPGGTTIKAVCKLEEKGFRNAIIQAVDACVKKSIEMSK